MKLKLIAVACMSVCAGGAFAAGVDSCAVANTAAAALTDASAKTAALQAALVNKCAPEVTMYISGASAQAGALTTILTNGTLFDATKPIVKVRDIAQSISGTGSTTTTASAGKDGNTIAFIGTSTAAAGGAGKRLMVIYNKANGSFAGVQQLLTKVGPAFENVTLVTTTAKEQATAAGKVVPCNLSTATADTAITAYATYECTTEVDFGTGWGPDKQKVTQLVLSDLRPTEATPGVSALAASYKWKASTFPNVVTAVQGFGVIVSPGLYAALVAKGVSNGQLAASCTSETIGNATDAITLACQPSLTAAEYSAVITGAYTTVDALTGNGDTTSTLALARRPDSSGTQGASSIFFGGSGFYLAKTPATDGYLAPKNAGTFGSLVVTENAGTGDVITAVSGAGAGFALGVVSLENTYALAKSSSKLKGANYVKINGFSPNLTTAGVDAKHRAAIQNGYPMVFEMQALTSTKLADPYKTIAATVVAGLKDPANNLAGLAYIGSTDATKNTPFTRNGNNFYPLTKY